MAKRDKAGAPLVIGGERRTFCFTLASAPDRVWELPTIDSVPSRLIQGVIDGAEADPVSATRAYWAVIDSYAPELRDFASTSDLREIVEAWGRASGVSLGE